MDSDFLNTSEQCCRCCMISQGVESSYGGNGCWRSGRHGCKRGWWRKGERSWHGGLGEDENAECKTSHIEGNVYSECMWLRSCCSWCFSCSWGKLHPTMCLAPAHCCAKSHAKGLPSCHPQRGSCEGQEALGTLAHLWSTFLGWADLLQSLSQVLVPKAACSTLTPGFQVFL